MLKKNDIVKLEITGFTNEGNGIGRAGGITVFVPFTAVGDVISCRIVKVKKTYCYGIIDEIIIPSESRCDPECDLYGKCGGCCFRHVTYAAELSEKEKFVYDAFTRIGKLEPKFEPIIGSESGERYRNKAQFPIAQDENGKLYSGFYAKRSHRPVRMTDCRLVPEIFNEIARSVIIYANGRSINAYDEETGKGLMRHIFIRRGAHSGEIMLAIVVTDIASAKLFDGMTADITREFPEIRSIIINENPQRTNVILGKNSKVIFGSEVIYDTMCGNRIAISLHSFYQINTLQAEKLYSKAAEYADLAGEETLLDLYCGAGTIGLSMAGKVKKLIGVEIVESAVSDARKNAAENGIENAEFLCSDAGKAALELYGRGITPDVIIADPARKGCTTDTLEFMARMNPERIVMISCNPATAARDCAILEDYGYRAVKCAAVDMFPRTGHVECVVLMSRVEK